METRIIDLSSSEPNWSLLDIPISSLQHAEVVAFPTETVYGLGGNALDSHAVDRIYEAKGRPSDNPLIVHIGYRSQLDDLVTEIPAVAQSLMDSFWPGPLTLLFNKKEIVPDRTTGGLPTVAVRMPSHPVALELLRRSKLPLAAPSANVSGKPSPTTALHVLDDLSGRIPYIIDGGPCQVGVESTILDVTTTPATLLRPGGITQKQIEACIGQVQLDSSLVSETSPSRSPKAPGMKYRHYSPKATVELIEKSNSTTQKIHFLCQEYQRERQRVMIIAKKKYDVRVTNYIIFLDENELAHDLFNYFRKADDEGIDCILIADVSKKGIGYSVLNRIKKAAKRIY